jgi:sugar-specific transcriptional regulator TrmB
MTIQKQIEKMGFIGREAIVLTTLLEGGRANTTTLSLKTGLARQTIKYIIDSLLKRGIISQIIEQRKKKFYTSTKLLTDFYQKQEDACKEAKKLISSLNTVLKSKNRNDEGVPQVSYFRGQAGLELLLKEIIQTASQSGDKTFRAYAMSKFYSGMEGIFNSFITQREKLGIKSKIIVPIHTDYAEIMGENTHKREFRKMDLKDIGATLYLISDKCYLFSYRDGVGVVIKNKTLSQFLVSIFDNHWSFLSQ